MNFVETALLDEKQKISLFKLWNREYPLKLKLNSLTDLDNYLKNLTSPQHILVYEKDEIAAWAFKFLRDKEKWFAMIINRDIQRKGYGTALLDEFKRGEAELNGWVIDHEKDTKSDGAKYISPLNFYLKNGFEVVPEVRLELDNISAVKIKWINP